MHVPSAQWVECGVAVPALDLGPHALAADAAAELPSLLLHRLDAGDWLHVCKVGRGHLGEAIEREGGHSTWVCMSVMSTGVLSSPCILPTSGIHCIHPPYLWDPLHARRMAPDQASGGRRGQRRGLQGAPSDRAQAALRRALAVLSQLADTAKPPGRAAGEGGCRITTCSGNQAGSTPTSAPPIKFTVCPPSPPCALQALLREFMTSRRRPSHTCMHGCVPLPHMSSTSGSSGIP